MLAQYLVPLTIVAAVGAIATLAVALLVVRRMGAVHAALATVETQLDDAAATLPARIRESRAMLAEQGAAAEHTLWTMQQYDRQMDKMSARLQSSGRSIDEMHESLERAKVAVARLVSATRLLMRVVELRRAILG